MCGLVGIWDRGTAAPAGDLQRRVERMSRAIVHRGPDDGGSYADATHGLALGFRRLAIIDVSPAGHQPMVSADGRFVIAYNGEIYNHGDLRRQLEGLGVRFRGSSDTEVMLEAFAAWGVAATLPKLNGMFAIALWDRAEAQLHLVRDRLGIKPLYWTERGGTLLFASELKALLADPAFRPPVDRDALCAYLRLGYIPAPHTIYRQVLKLEPGRHLTVGIGRPPEIEAYWSLPDVVRSGRAARRAESGAEAVDRLEALLKDAVGQQMMADVPLGAFLSGGIDSSTVVALMQAQSGRPVRTFTIGFEEADYNEAGHARRVARHLGTEHTEVTIDPGYARAVIPRLAEIYDEPFADSSQIPTFLLSEVTRRSVTVALSGDGGDELFAGYERYRITRQLWRRIGWMPAPLRALLGAGCRIGAHPALGRLIDHAPRPLGLGVTSGRLLKLADTLAGNTPDALYRQIVSQWGRPERLLAGGGREAPHALNSGAALAVAPDLGERMRYLDLETYLPDDILTKVDRASMATSLEARVPLLDHRLVEHAFTLPESLLVGEGGGKWLLRQVLHRHVPAALVERPKMGFGVPIAAWLRGPLREWAEALLAERRLVEAGLEPQLIRARWLQHAAGRQDWAYPLWTILMLQAWLERWK